MSKDIRDSNQLSIGRYEILFSSFGGDRQVQYLNNASVKSSEIGLEYTIEWKDEEKTSIDSISFYMPSDENKLSDVFDVTPYGLIKKNRTGIGATTLELRSKRNSIIVVPTRALAYNKAKRTKIRNTKNKYAVLYVGGNIPHFSPESIEEYLADGMIPNKKFIVVADSLYKLLAIIGEENYKNYFLMVDEVDSYQYDSYYRKPLEDVIDYYFDFPPEQRCLVSATVGVFSNKNIEEEPVINVRFNKPQPRSIKMLHTDNVIVSTVKHIKYLLETYPDDKILIAYNSVRGGVLQIIESLNESLRSKCAVLCSEKSKLYADTYYSDIVEERLPNQITFMTSTYFVGIDISERFHLISISEASQIYTLLSEDKLEQIAGRCRHEEGLKSETIIYQSRERIAMSVWLFPPTNEELRDTIVKDALLLTKFVNTIPELKSKFKGLAEEWLNNINLDAIIDWSYNSYYSSRSVRLLRKNVHDEFVPAYLNIDNILIQYNILNNLYLSKETLHESLTSQGHIILEWKDVEENEYRIPIELQEHLDEHFTAVEEDEIQNITGELGVIGSIEERAILANRLKMSSSKKGEMFIDRFVELQKYVPFTLLVKSLAQYQSKNKDKYNWFYNSVMFWALSEEHSFKIAFKEKFPLKTHLSNQEIRVRLNDLLMSNVNLKEIATTNMAIRYLQLFCNISDRVRNRKLGNPYGILNYDVNGFGEPINRISATTRVSDIFRFSRTILRN